MALKSVIKKGHYYDSVSLMIVTKKIASEIGVLDAAVVMGTEGNKSILESSGLFLQEFEKANDTDLLIIIKAEGQRELEEAHIRVEELLDELRHKSEDVNEFTPKSIEGATKILPEANMALISVAGQYAGYEAMNALNQDLHVLLFSDNVDLETEIKLKQKAKEKGLLLMGPGCGTAIINGVPLAFANVITRGNIGIVAASGTGLQEISSIITNEGAGISQAIGTGGRDIKKEVGGIMFIEGLKALIEDEETEVIVLVSKPPDLVVQKKIAKIIEETKKPVVTIFLGGSPEIMKNVGAISVTNLEEASLMAVIKSKKIGMESFKKEIANREELIKKIAGEEIQKMGRDQKYIRGLFSGGTLCYETQLILRDMVGDIYGNVSLKPELKLENSLESHEHSMIDLGEEEFTAGRPHPMIDFSLRKKRILKEAKDPEVGVIILDVVLGHGSNMDPGIELVSAIKESIKIVAGEGRHLSFICSITGTERDPQDKKKVKRELLDAGAIVMETNAAASKLAGYIVEKL
ncbi:MAG: acyl-CoA synthetase FdrA [Candidatus Hodarchaeales archaeon]|jgi:succinyl-CoA synthetase alpha subunit